MLRNVRREEAIILAECIHRHFVEAAAYVDGYATRATVSIGVVISEDTTLDMPALLAQADRALYYAKERGRNRVEIANGDVAPSRAGKSPRRRSCPRKTRPRQLSPA